jgi:stage II sporulation SpoE-like protein
MDERVRRAAGRRSLAVVAATAAAACAAAGVPAAFAGGDGHPPGAVGKRVAAKSPAPGSTERGHAERGLTERGRGGAERAPQVPGAGSPHRGGGRSNRGAGSPNRGAGSPNRGAGSPNRGAGSPHRGAGSPDRGGGRRGASRAPGSPGGRRREGARPGPAAPVREGSRAPAFRAPAARVPATEPEPAAGAPSLRQPSALVAPAPSAPVTPAPSAGSPSVGGQPSGGQEEPKPSGDEGWLEYGGAGGNALRERPGGRSRRSGRRLTATRRPSSGPAFADSGAAPSNAVAAAGAALSTAPTQGAAPDRGRRARSNEGRARSRPERGGGGVPRKIGRTLTKAVEVVPESIKALLGALAAISLILLGAWALAATRARRLARQRRALLKDVGALQGALLPAVPARVGALAVSAAYRPADGPVAGGDFYDVFSLPGGRVGMMVGDLSGHGRDALAPTAFLRYTLRAHMEAGTGLRESLKLTEEAFERAPMVREAGRPQPALAGGPPGDAGLPGAGNEAGELPPPSRRFATVMLALYDPAERTLTYAGAGHPPPIVVGPDERPPVTACSAPPLGLGMETGTRETTVSLPRGAVACLYTDGLPEARSAGRMLGDERLAQMVRELGPDDGAEKLVSRVAEEADAVPDDLAVCLVRPARAGAGEGPPVRIEQLEVGPGEADAAGRFLDACGVPRAQSVVALGRIAATLAGGERALLRVGLTGERPTVETLAAAQVA